MQSEERLKNISAHLKKGVVPPSETVRSFLSWFGASRRGYNVSANIKEELAQHGLRTDPDFEYAYIDGQISFQLLSEPNSETTPLTDPTHRIARLASANRPPVSIRPDTSLREAVTLMMSHDFSQLPVMTSSREVKGVVSWKTIGSRLALRRTCATGRECMEPAQELPIDASLASAMSIIAEYDYVLVRAKDQQICGIVTAADLTEQFQKLSEPFLLVGEIENGVRRLLYGRFTTTELSAVKDPTDQDRKIDAVTDLTFGEYARLLEPDENWKKLQIEIDRVEFIKHLHQIREIRNDVMHFDPDGLDEDDLRMLREFSAFLRRLREIGAA